MTFEAAESDADAPQAPAVGGRARGGGVAAFLLRRALQAVGVLLAISTILFFLLRLSGDPAALLLGPDATPRQVAQLRSAMGLDEPLIVQYVRFTWGVMRLQFGDSLVAQRDALGMVWDALPNTLLLGGAGLALGLLVAVPLGIYSALRRGSVSSVVAMLLAVVGQSMPSFWLAIMLVLIFAVYLRWLPSFGTGTIRHLVLPAVTLSAFVMARHARLIRSGLLEVLGEDYIRTARAKGVPARLVVTRHALRNALIPVVTVLAIDISLLVSGTVVIETVFSWPGMGRQMINAVGSRDYPVVQATVFVVALLVLAINFGVDLLYRYLDPRIRIE